MPAVLGIASQHSANADMHSHTTAPEILAAFKGKELDYWVSGFGTDGTLKGVVRVLKAARPNIHIIATEPEGLSPDAIEKMYRDLVNYFVNEEMTRWQAESTNK